MNDLPVYKVLQDAAAQWPDLPAVHDEQGTINFSGLLEASEKLRAALIASGIKPGMGVGMMARNGRTFIIGLFAVAGCGATVMPLYHMLKQHEIDDIIRDAGLHVIIDDRSGIQPVAETVPVKESGFHFGYTGIPFTGPIAPHVQQPVFIRFTSGTTGRSKGVVISHRSVIERVEAANKGLGLGPGDTVVWVLPMAYHFVVSIVLYVKFGAAIAVVDNFLAKNIITVTNKYNGTLLYSSPMQIRLLANDKGTEMMPSLKKAISTSAGIGLDVCLAFKARFGIDVSQAYGIIEIGLPMLNYQKSAEHPDAVGYALPDFDVAILNDDHQPLPAGAVGHLAIKGPGMFDAYLLPARTREEVCINGYFLTADYASKTDDGLVKIEGRAKSVINISGIKVFPEEVEAFLEQIPGIKLARISSSPHPLMGQIIEGEIMIEPGADIDVETVISYCKKRMSAFKAPQKLKIVDSLPMTATGKLQRN